MSEWKDVVCVDSSGAFLHELCPEEEFYARSESDLK
jgi:hypothetical protein